MAKQPCNTSKNIEPFAAQNIVEPPKHIFKLDFHEKYAKGLKTSMDGFIIIIIVKIPFYVAPNQPCCWENMVVHQLGKTSHITQLFCVIEGILNQQLHPSKIHCWCHNWNLPRNAYNFHVHLCFPIQIKILWIHS